jgi:hypothetical protein
MWTLSFRRVPHPFLAARSPNACAPRRLPRERSHRQRRQRRLSPLQRRLRVVLMGQFPLSEFPIFVSYCSGCQLQRP